MADDENLSEKAREAVLNAVIKMAPKAGSAESLRQLAEAIAMLDVTVEEDS